MAHLVSTNKVFPFPLHVSPAVLQQSLTSTSACLDRADSYQDDAVIYALSKEILASRLCHLCEKFI